MAVPIIAGQTITSSNGATAVASIDVTVPSGVSMGDFLVIMCGNDYAATTVQQWDDNTLKPSGFTLIKQITTATADACCAAFYKIADGTEGGTTITVPAGTANDMWAACLHITGVRGVDPIGVIGANYDVASTSSASIPGITTLGTNRLVLFCASADGGDTNPFTVGGTGWVKGDEAEAGTNGTGSVAGLWGYKEMPTAGATGNATVSFGGSADGMSGFMYSIEPVGIPTIIRETFFDSTGTEYANGTVVYAYNADGTYFATGAVGTITGIRNDYPTALTTGEVAFTQPEGVLDQKFLVVEPTTDTDGLVTNLITPTQLT